jgi:prevent-host-death family protein
MPDDANLATMKATTREPEIVTRNGKPVSVIIPIEDYKELLERAEDVEDVKKLHYRPLEEYISERNGVIAWHI